MDQRSTDRLHTCPFQCGVTSSDFYAIEVHLEECPLNVNFDESRNSAFTAAASTVQPPTELAEDDEWIRCPREECRDYLLMRDIPHHLAIHSANDHDAQKSPARGASTRSSIASSFSQPPPPLVPSSISQVSSGTGLLEYFSGASRRRAPPASKARSLRVASMPGRLGTKQLGPHAYEKVMPADVRKHLVEDALPHYSYRIGRDGKLIKTVTVDNETGGLIRVLSDLCALDEEIQVAYLCHPSVRHVHKLQCDGNFCGYWNIQMLLSYLQQVDIPRNMQRLPDILEIQDTIEEGWSNGIGAYGLVETGGIRGTRKWIGTHEAATYFAQLGVPVDAMSFYEDGSKGASSSTTNEVTVINFFDHIEAYFMSGLDDAKSHRTSFITQLPPLFFQRHGHSMTIVGMERRKDGFRNLLVFDPSFRTAKPMERLLNGHRTTSRPEELLKPYRRSDSSLTAWDEFEIVVPKASPQTSPVPTS